MLTYAANLRKGPGQRGVLGEGRGRLSLPGGVLKGQEGSQTFTQLCVVGRGLSPSRSEKCKSAQRFLLLEQPFPRGGSQAGSRRPRNMWARQVLGRRLRPAG